MSLLVSRGLPLLGRPPKLYEYITKDIVYPTFSDYSWTSTGDSLTEETVVDTGCVGYDLCSICVREVNEFGEVDLFPYAEAVYDAETGEVTFPEQDSEGIEYEIDFYKDGEFQTLTPHMIRFLGRATAIVWDERFERNWLNITPKTKDDSFQTINESNYIEKNSERLERNTNALNAELKKYEQDVAYRNIVNMNVQNKILF